ncbi:MAG: copper oxidase [Nitrospira sp.]|nr:copper oxidase [Nitrospira sp.]
MKCSRLVSLIGGLMLGTAQLASAGEVNFKVTDIPGYWFDLDGMENPHKATRSLAIVPPGTKVNFWQEINGMKVAESKHTVTSLLWPSTAGNDERIDQPSANQANHSRILTTPGLYVFFCKLHPYMLGGVIVDDPTTKTESGDAAFDIGNQLTLLIKREVTDVGNVTFDSNSNLGLRLLRAFFIVTTPSNWKDYTKVGQAYKPTYPAVPVVVTGGAVVPNLEAALQATFDGDTIPRQKKPRTKGIGEVWVDTQYELTDKNGKGANYPGTATVVSATGWNVTRKIALPDQLMNNGHNFWASNDQKEIYQTEWHGNSLFVINRRNGKLIQEIDLVNGDEVKAKGIVCHDPAHVMTRLHPGTSDQQVHVGCNGDDGVIELDRLPNGTLTVGRLISIQDPNNLTKQTQPHAHWMGFNGEHMVTPNSNSADSTLYEFTGWNTGHVLAKNETGPVSIASGMMPDSSKYYVTNYLGHSISVMNGPRTLTNYTGVGGLKGAGPYAPGEKIKDISLIQGYDLVKGCEKDEQGKEKCVDGFIGGLPVQVPVSPDGKFVITGNTLGGTITIVDATTDTLVRILPCDPGCHGVNFGAKKGGGYYAYVTSKFANRLIVLDYDPNNNGDASDAVIAGWVVLANDHVAKDDKITGNKGQGGQGVLPVPNVYNGWVQELPIGYRAQLTKKQRNPIGPIGGGNPHP